MASGSRDGGQLIEFMAEMVVKISRRKRAATMVAQQKAIAAGGNRPTVARRLEEAGSGHGCD